MENTRPRLYIDIVDPLSYWVTRVVRELHVPGGSLEYVPVELRPPPAPLTDTEDPFWAPRWAVAVQHLRAPSTAEAPLSLPRLVPSSRKAHELVSHARGAGRDAEMVAALQRGFVLEGLDVGRVDVLVEIASDLGFDRTEAKAVLDVDKHEAAVSQATARARATGVSVPCIELRGRRLEGFHNREAIGTFLARN